MYFQYGQEETEYLSGKDEKLGAVIAQVGRVNREVDTDLFSAVVHHIVGQQISTKAQATIWQRMRGALARWMPSIFWKQGTSNYSCLASAAARQSTSRTLHEKSRMVSLIWRASGRSRMRK